MIILKGINLEIIDNIITDLNSNMIILKDQSYFTNKIKARNI